MNKFLFDEIENKLTGLRLIYIGRTCNMLEVGFASPNSLNAAREQEVFHVQVPFRIINNKKIITTDSDIYYPFDSSNESYSYLERPGESIFDMVVKQLDIPNHSFVIESILFSEFGDVQIKMLEGNDTLEVSFYNNASSTDDYECWRFFSWHHLEIKHIVCYSNEVKKE